MLDIQALERLLTDLESDQVERKPSLNDRVKIRQAICAFANDLPNHGAAGHVFVGVSDDGHPLRLPITDEALRILSDMRSDGNILPIPHMSVNKVALQGIPVAVVEVLPSEGLPVRYKGQTWIRVGPRRAIASVEEERRLMERQISRARPFDQRPCADAAIEDLLVDSFRNEYLPRAVAPAVIAENRRAIQEQLASLRLFDLVRAVPTHAGLLVIGKNPGAFLPGAYIQFVRYEGRALSDAVHSDKTITGNLLTQLTQLENLLPLQIRTARAPVSALAQESVADYPLPAIREIALNAVMHRSYEGTNAPIRINWFSDRVEIQNPGGLYGQVTPHNYEHTSDYRNPVLAEAMKALGYVERFGVGIARAKAALHANGNPAPEFTFESTQVLVTVRSRG